MIDLIANGLALQSKKQKVAVIYDPQPIRNPCAEDKCDAHNKPAQSAYSAKRKHLLNENVLIIDKPDNALTHDTADYAEYADHQSSTTSPFADSLQKICGLDDFDFAGENSPKSLDLIQCNICNHFMPDTIGDGSGIGHCTMNIKWTSSSHGKMPLYRYADRYCVQYQQI